MKEVYIAVGSALVSGLMALLVVHLTNCYNRNLDAIIFVGYHVNSRRATAFRIRATSILREYMIKGFAMDDERLKQGQTLFGKDYFRKLLPTDASSNPILLLPRII